MLFLEKIPTVDLIFVSHCEESKDLARRYQSHEIDHIFKMTKPWIKFKHQSNKVSQAMFSVLTDTLTYSTILLWTIIGLINFSLMPLAILTGVCFLIGIVTAGFDFFSTYRKLKKVDEKINQQLQFRHLQIMCYDELIRRTKKMHPVLKKKAVNNENVTVHKKVGNKISHLNQAMKSTLVVATTVFGTYYASMIAITSAFGLSVVAGSMLGPIGIGIAIGMSLIMGFYFGYQLYKANQNAWVLKRELKSSEDELEIKQQEYLSLRQSIENRSKQKIKKVEEKKSDFNDHKKNYTFANKHHMFTRKNKFIVDNRVNGPIFNRAL